MKVVILAGGFGTRLMEETESRPKPMVEIGGKPILWHIMKIYEYHGFNDFIICLGYKGKIIKDYFLNFYYNSSDFTIDLTTNNLTIHNSTSESFKVTLVETGLETNTAGRIKKIKPYLDNETFMMTYGDGLSDINLHELISFHKSKSKIATLTSVQIPGRYGNIDMSDDGMVRLFHEKPDGDGMWINGGFFILEPEIFNYLNGNVDEIQWEKGPLLEIAKNNELAAFKHYGFWKCMDALRDRTELEEIWKTGKAKWKKW
jgi:glucose-1-phosphate cytidylyltransferase